MLSYIARRTVATLPVMGVVAIFVFSLLYFAPGDPAVIIAGDQATNDEIERIRQSLGLDQPYVVRLAEWIWNVAHLDLGRSIFTGIPVTELIGQRLGATVSLMAITLLLAVVVAVPIGVLAAWKAGTWIDNLVVALAVFGFSVPVFVIGYLLAYFFSVQLRWLPVQGYMPLSQGVAVWLRHLILPATALSFVFIALIARITRATMLEVLGQDYVRTARAKGVGDARLLFIHCLKNSAIPVITIIGIGMAALVGGAVVIETVFAIPGVGRLTVDAILRRDYPVIQGIIIVFSFAYVLINLAIDISYTLVDPRVRY